MYWLFGRLKPSNTVGCGTDGGNTNDEEDEDKRGMQLLQPASVDYDAIAATDNVATFLYAMSSSDTAQEQLMAVESFAVKGRCRFMQTSLTTYFSSLP